MLCTVVAGIIGFGVRASGEAAPLPSPDPDAPEQIEPTNVQTWEGNATPWLALRERLNPRHHAANMDWYIRQGLIPRINSLHRAGQRLGGMSRRSGLDFAPGGDRVLPTQRGAYRHRQALSGPANYSVDLRPIPFIEPRGITITNTGTAPILNPWVVVNSTGDWFDTARIVKSAIGTETDQEAIALRLWEFLRNNRYHWLPVTEEVEVHSPAKFLNVWGYGFCDDSANNLEALAKAAGITQSRVWGLGGHVVAELFYKGGWHMMDPDLEVFAPLVPTNRGQASVAQIAANPAYAPRVGPPGIWEFYASTSDNSTYQNWFNATRNMGMTLRPGESLSRRFGNWGKYAAFAFPTDSEPPLYGNGQQHWDGDFSRVERRAGLSSVTRGAWFEQSPYLRPTNTGTLKVNANLSSAYAVVGGRVTVDVSLADDATLVLRARRSSDVTMTDIALKTGPYTGSVEVSIDDLIGRIGKLPVYGYFVELEITPGPMPAQGPVTGIDRLDLLADLQLAPVALPRLLGGRLNTVAVTMTAGAAASLNVELDWDEEAAAEKSSRFVFAQNATVSPLSVFDPIAPMAPRNGGSVKTLSPTLTWTGGVVPDEVVGWRSVRITHDPDGRFPVAPQLMPRGLLLNSFTVPPDWLEPNKSYYWQVREGNNREPRSDIFKFTVTRNAQAASAEGWENYE